MRTQTTPPIGAAPPRPPAVSRCARGEAPAQPTWIAYLGRAGLIKIAVIGGLFAWLYHEEFYRLFLYWQSPDWSHGFLIVPACLYFLYQKKPEFMLDPGAGSLCGAALMVVSFSVYAGCIYLKIGYPQQLSMVSMLAGIVLLVRGWRSLWHSAFPIGFLLLAIPPPDRVYKAVTQPLQQAAASIATVVLNVFPGADVERGGINIAYFMRGGYQGTFTVAGACSGMRSLMAFIALGLGMAYFTKGPFWHRLVMVIIVVPVAIFCNVLRVIITGAFQMYQHGELASGTPHTVLGLLMFALGFSIYFGAMYLLDHIYVEADADDQAPPQSLGAAR